MNTPPIHSQVLSLVEPLAAHLQAMQQQTIESHVKAGSGAQADIATTADEYSDQYLREHLPTILPGSRVISEETEPVSDDTTQEYLWIVDPLDGTINYSHRLPLYGVSIALFQGEQPVYGLLYFPALDQYVAADADRQLQFGTPVTLMSQQPGGVPYVTLCKAPTLSPAEHGRLVQDIGERIRTPRDFGCCIYQAYLAIIGQVDCAIMYNVAIWDMAAAVYIADCAGLTTHYWSEPLAAQLHTQADTGQDIAAYQQRLAVGRRESIEAVKMLEW